MPSLLLIKFDEYSGLEFLQCRPGIVPVFPTTRQFEYKGAICSQLNFPYVWHMQLQFIRVRG